MIVLILSCNTTKKANSASNFVSNSPYGLMIGSFNSEAQSLRDTMFYNISLHMYPIWKEKADHYLYVEQALATMQDKPYRQRVYKVTELPNGVFESVVYKIADEKSFIGKWKDPKYFIQIVV